MWVHLWTFKAALVRIGFGYHLHSLILALPQDSAQYDSAAPPPPPLTPIQELDDAHAHMDRLEQRMKQMRVSDGAINWNDFDGALVASLPAQFRMLEIERTWDNLTQEFLRQFAFNTVIDALYDIDEGIAKGLWPESSLTDSKEKKPSGGQRPEDVGLKETSYLIPLALSPIDCYSSCTEVDTTILLARYALSRAFQKLIEGGLLTQLASRLIPQPVPPQFKMDLHCAYHQESIVLDDGYEVDTVGSQTFTSSSLISNWVPFEVTPTTPSATALESSSTPPLVARPFDGVVSHEEALTQIRVETTTTLEGLIHIMTADRATCHKVPSVLLDNGWALNVCLLSTTIALGYAPLDFGPFTQTVRAYDSTKRKVMGTLMIELLIGPATFPILFQVLKIPTSFNLLLSRPWIHRAKAIFHLPFIRR
ncbi:hypothetical protein CK203_108073 [Vitis vinifera]|uniref:Uncharacterized protein n=1 Tax=Vitis vinifera TaxID=29760 RepID=A0A438DJG7_VITVI|nr:hypothetical protein CK203_108073 [Vitis vinifera]